MSDPQSTLQDPWYTGLGYAPFVGSEGAPTVGLGGEAYVIDPKEYRRGFVDAYRSAQDTTSIPGEATLNVEGVWSRYGRDWRYGAGQPRFDRPDSDRRRFQDSLGINPWTEGKLSLLTKTEKIRNENKTYKRLLTGKTGQLVIARADGVDVVTGTWPTLTTNTATGLPGSGINDITMDDDEVWVATTTGVFKFPLAGLAGARYDGDASAKSWDSIALINGRLVGGSGATLWEISTAASTAVHAHPSPAFRWTVLFGHPNYIYAGGTIGSVSELFRFGVNESTGAIAKGIPSLNLPGGEILRAGIHYVQQVLLATSKGVRLCSVNNGALEYGRVISQVGDCRTLTAFGDFVWFGWTGIDTSRTGVGRCAPGRFGDVEGQVPAWARDVWWEGSGTVSGCTVHAGRIVFAVDTVGVMIANDELVASGWLTTGAIDFDIPYTIQPLDMDLRHEPLDGTVAVEWRPVGNTAWVSGGVSNVVDSRQSPTLVFTPTQAAGIELKLTLNRKDIDEGPVLQLWRMRAAPQPSRLEQIVLPIVFADGVTANHLNAPAMFFDPLAAWQALARLCRAGAVVSYQEGPTVYTVKVKDVQMAKPTKWSAERKFFDGTVLVILHVV